MLDRIKKISKNKDAKTILENFISLSALQVIGMILPLVTLPYVLRVIGFEKYGVIVFASSLVAYFTSLTDFSFKITATRDIAIHKHSKKMINLIYSKVLTIKLLFLLLSWFLIFLIVVLYPPFREIYDVYFYSSLMLLGYVLFPEWFFQGIEKMRYITYLNLGIKLFFTLCIFLFIKEEKDYWIYPLLQSLGYIGAGIVGQYFISKNFGLNFRFISFKRIKRTIKSNFPLFINQFLPNLYNNTTTFILGLISPKELVGIYQSLLIVINLSSTIIEIFSRVFFPYLNRKKNSFKGYKKLMTFNVLLMVTCILIGHQLIFWYLHIDYKNAFLILLILSIGLIGYTYSNIFGLNYFIIKRQDKLVMKNTLRASLIGLILGYPLILQFGIVGAAINLSLARLMMGGGLYIKYLKNK